MPAVSSSHTALRPSSNTNYRPPSSSSIRPNSRLSTRSNLRNQSSRLVSLAQVLVKQITGFDESCGTLEASNIRESVDFVVKNIEATALNKGAAGVDIGVVGRQIKNLALKARINVQDDLSEALVTCFDNLKQQAEHGEKDLDDEIQKSRIPDHLHFLLKLSAVPTKVTRMHAASYLYNRVHPPSPPKPLTWSDIVAEEPFEGEHWEGLHGLPPGYIRRSTVEDGVEGSRDDKSDWDSTPSLSPLRSDDLDLETEAGVCFEGSVSEEHNRVMGSDLTSNLNLGAGSSTLRLEMIGAKEIPPFTCAHRKEFEALQGKQYWRDDWKGILVPSGKKNFDLGDAFTLGPTLDAIFPLSETEGFLTQSDRAQKYINEEDAVREVIIALQGRRNIIFEWNANQGEGCYIAIRPTLRLLHLSRGTQSSILSSLSQTATTVQRLRQFVALVYNDVIGRKKPQNNYPTQHAMIATRTRESFADAIDQEIRRLDKWCASREEAVYKSWNGVGTAGASEDANDGKLVISFLDLETAVRDEFERTFEVLLDLASDVYPRTSGLTGRGPSAAATTAKLLDRLFENVQEHLERQDKVTSEALMQVFIRTVEPIWDMLGRWLQNGMNPGVASGAANAEAGSELDEEFFIVSNGLSLGVMGVGLLDPEFWKEGYKLREEDVFEDNDFEEGKQKRCEVVPRFLTHVSDIVLRAGKAVGLLRAMRVSLSPIKTKDGLGHWHTFANFLGSFSASLPEAETDSLCKRQRVGDWLFSVSIHTLSRFIYDKLLPRCRTADALLVQVLTEECDIWRHLRSMEDLFLMRRGDAITHFSDILFAKMDAQQSWGDFHFLNAAFSDVVEASSGNIPWIRSSLVRLFFHGGRDKEKTAHRSVKPINGMGVEYAVPFPLTYIFKPKSINTYGEIFVFLLQIRRAKSVLERIRVLSSERGKMMTSEIKVFYAMGGRLSWVMNTVLNFLTTHVIQAQITKFHRTFEQAKSLDEMVQLHDDHLDRIRGQLFLTSQTSSLYRVIHSILDMAMHFTNTLVTFVGDTSTTQDLSRSVSIRRYRSRRQRRQRRNSIGFTSSLRDLHDSDSSDDGGTEYGVQDIDVTELSFSISASASYDDQEFYNQTERMSTELDGLVRFFRRGVESLAGGAGEAAPAFGVLAFALQDWDN